VEEIKTNVNVFPCGVHEPAELNPCLGETRFAITRSGGVDFNAVSKAFGKR
jgi:hypothetical protein